MKYPPPSLFIRCLLFVDRIHFFFKPQGFRQDLGFQELGGTIKKTPPNFFFSPQKRSSRASRAPPCRPQSGEAKGAPGLIAAMSSFTAVCLVEVVCLEVGGGSLTR